MQRASSFFWASDDFHAHADENEDEHRIGVSCSIEEGSGDEEFNEQQTLLPSCSSPERVALKESLDGYGTAASIEKHINHIDNTAAGVDSAIAIDTTADGGRRRLFHHLPHHQQITANNHINKSTELSVKTKDLGNKSIRFQVVIWHLGTIDVQTGHVKMRARLTIFWNDDSSSSPRSKKSTSTIDHGDNDVWVMDGRQRAYRKTWSIDKGHDVGGSSVVKEMVDVPPVSILNAVEFEIVDDVPDIVMLDQQTRSMRWTCMYNATLFQGDHMSVKDFPHDRHQIKLKVGILAHRGRGHRWDHNVYKLGLAGPEDSQGSTRVPHGLVVDHCHVPDFGFDKSDLRFQFLPLMFGGWKESSPRDNRDLFLQVTLPMYRQSGHYDTSILPMLVMLNIIAISCLPRNFASATAATEIMLSIAFVQVGIRLTLDSRLPSVGYQIKMQIVMNSCFWLLSGLVLESNCVFFLVKKRGWEIAHTDKIDVVTACAGMVYNGYIIMTYFRGARRKNEG